MGFLTEGFFLLAVIWKYQMRPSYALNGSNLMTRRKTGSHLNRTT